MPRVVIDGETEVVNVTSITNYTDDLLGEVPGLVFVRIIGTVESRGSGWSGNKLVDTTQTKPFDKVLNVLLLREWKL